MRMRCSTLLAILTLVLLYLVMGALVFQTLEIPQEKRAHGRALSAQLAFLENHSCVTSEHLQDFTQSVVDALAAGVDARSLSSNLSSRWDLQNAFFFCGTIITTIGFGNMSPRSQLGQLFCMFYALVGIPMFGILLAGVGDHLGTMLHRAVTKIETLFLLKTVSPTCVRVISAVFSILIGCLIFIAVPTVVFQEVESWSWLEASYFVVITLTTVGFGDYVADYRSEGMPMYKPLVWLWIVFGLSYFASILTMIGNWLRALSKKTRAEMEGLRAHASDWTQNIQSMSMDFRLPVPLDLNEAFQLQRRRHRKRPRRPRPPVRRASLGEGGVWGSGHPPPCSQAGRLSLPRLDGWGPPQQGVAMAVGSRLGFAMATGSHLGISVAEGYRLGSRPRMSRSEVRLVSRPASVRAASRSSSGSASVTWSDSEGSSCSAAEAESVGWGRMGGEERPVVMVGETPPRPTLLDFFGENLAYIDESTDTLSDRTKPSGSGSHRPGKPKRRSMRWHLQHWSPKRLERELQPPSYPPTPPPLIPPTN